MQRLYQNNSGGAHRGARYPNRGGGRGMHRGIGRCVGGRIDNFEQRPRGRNSEDQLDSAHSFRGVPPPVFRAFVGQSLKQRRAEIELEVARIRKQEAELVARRREIRAAVKHGMLNARLARQQELMEELLRMQNELLEAQQNFQNSYINFAQAQKPLPPLPSFYPFPSPSDDASSAPFLPTSNTLSSMRVPHVAKRRVLPLAEFRSSAPPLETPDYPSSAPFQADQEDLSQESDDPSSPSFEGVLQESLEQFNFRSDPSGLYQGCSHCHSRTHSSLGEHTYPGPPQPQEEVCFSCFLLRRAPQGALSNHQRMETPAEFIFSDTPLPSPLAAIFQEAMLEMDTQSNPGQADDAGSYGTFNLNRPNDDINANFGEVTNDEPPPPYSLEA